VAKLWPILAPIAALAVNVGVQVIAVRLARGRHFLRAIVLGFLAGAAALLAAEALFPISPNPREAWIIAVLVNLPLYGALSYCFFTFANLGQSSIRIRIYDEIAHQPAGVSTVQIMQEYDEAALMENRLDRLIESGDLVLRDGEYFLGKKRLVPIASVIFATKRFVLGKTSEFG
jgi:hypothetical protein